MLSYFDFVDLIVEFNDDTPINLIKHIKPKILVKGADYFGKDIVGTDIVLAEGGKIQYIDYIEEYSSTKIIEKIQNGYRCK